MNILITTELLKKMGSVKSDEAGSRSTPKRLFRGGNPQDDRDSQEGPSSSTSVEDLASRVQELEKMVIALQAFHGVQHQQKDRFGFSRRSLPSADRGDGDGGRPESHFNSITERIRTGDFRVGENAGQGWKLEIKRWKRVNNRYGSSDLYDESQKIEDIRRKEQEIRSGGYVLSVYDEYDMDGTKMHTLLEIQSTPLLELLRQVITFYPGDDYDILRGKDATDDTVTFASPYTIFFSYRKQLQQSLEGDFSDEQKQHLKMLLDFIKKERPQTSLKLTEIEEGRCHKISFDKLWLLYPPNTAVYSFKGEDERQLVVYSHHTNDWKGKGLPKSIHLVCWEISFEQGVFKRDFDDWIIHPYAGEKNVSNLELVPAWFIPNENQLRDKLIARGRRYFELNKVTSLQDYYGNRFPRVYKDVRHSIPAKNANGY